MQSPNFEKFDIDSDHFSYFHTKHDQPADKAFLNQRPPLYKKKSQFCSYHTSMLIAVPRYIL